MTHNPVQASCSGPSFAFGEVYGLRQWTISPAAWSSSPLKKIRLTGHYSNPWAITGNVASCQASRSFHLELAVDAAHPPLQYLDRKQHGTAPIYLIDLILPWVKYLIRQNGISLRDVHRVEINGGNTGGVVIAQADTIRDDLLVMYSELGMYEYDKVGRFVERSRADISYEYAGVPYSYPTPSMSHMLRYSVHYSANIECNSVAQPDCTCGFYAYNNVASLAKNSYTNDASVFGLVRGHGKVTIGQKGFRAEKCDIVGLSLPVFFEANHRTETFRWKPSSTSKNYGLILEDTLKDHDVKLFADPDALFDFARVHLESNEI